MYIITCKTMQSLVIPFADAVHYKLTEPFELIQKSCPSSRDFVCAIKCSERDATMFVEYRDCKNKNHNVRNQPDVL